MAKNIFSWDSVRNSEYDGIFLDRFHGSWLRIGDMNDQMIMSLIPEIAFTRSSDYSKPKNPLVHQLIPFIKQRTLF